MIVSWKAWKSFKSEWLSSLVTCPSPFAPADCSEPQDVAPSARHCWWECPSEETRQPEARAQPEPQSHHSWRNKRWLVATCCSAVFLWQWHIPCRQVEDKIKASTQDKQTPNPKKNDWKSIGSFKFVKFQGSPTIPQASILEKLSASWIEEIWLSSSSAA